jgi:anti-anti-sigma regulatory factor
MATIIFSATQQRLSVRGPCLNRDFHHLLSALETFGQGCPQLVLDITGVAVMPRAMAESLLRSCRRLESAGIAVRLRVRPDGAVDRMLQVVRSELNVSADRVAAERKAG